MHSYFYPIHSEPRGDHADLALLVSFAAGVLFGSLLAASFSDLGGREIALALLSSPRSTGTCVLWLILPLCAGLLISMLRPGGLLLVLPLMLGLPFGYCVFFLLRFLGAAGLRASLLLLGANVAAFPGLFWFLSGRLRGENGPIMQDFTLAALMCLAPGLVAESILTPLLREFVYTISK